jgi:hypothetical protein
LPSDVVLDDLGEIPVAGADADGDLRAGFVEAPGAHGDALVVGPARHELAAQGVVTIALDAQVQGLHGGGHRGPDVLRGARVAPDGGVGGRLAVAGGGFGSEDPHAAAGGQAEQERGEQGFARVHGFTSPGVLGSKAVLPPR